VSLDTRNVALSLDMLIAFNRQHKSTPSWFFASAARAGVLKFQIFPLQVQPRNPEKEDIDRREEMMGASNSYLPSHTFHFYCPVQHSICHEPFGLHISIDLDPRSMRVGAQEIAIFLFFYSAQRAFHLDLVRSGCGRRSVSGLFCD
jgi:hypothetical protein